LATTPYFQVNDIRKPHLIVCKATTSDRARCETILNVKNVELKILHKVLAESLYISDIGKK
jgi:hypothetical protein